jgi:hypothetical protein
VKIGFDRKALVRNIDGEKFRFEEPLSFRDKLGREFVIPTGFVTDFASSQIGRWDTLPPKASRSESAALHDWLYVIGTVSRLEADQLFREALQSQGLSAWICLKAYLGVRVGGWVAWAKHRRAQGDGNDWDWDA